MGLYNWMLEYRWGPVKTDLAAESERIRRQIREAQARRKGRAAPMRRGPTDQERGAPCPGKNGPTPAEEPTRPECSVSLVE